MTRRELSVTFLAVISIGSFLPPVALAQSPQTAQKFAQTIKQLNLSPEQKAQLLPILEAEAPKISAIRSDASLSRLQKLEQMRAIHAESAPRVKTILTPEQYQ